MSAACTCEAGQDRSRSASAGVAHEQGVLSIQNDTLHFAFADIVVDCDRAVGTEDVSFLPLPKGIIHCLSHGMLGQQLLFPEKKLFMETSQHWLSQPAQAYFLRT